MSTKGLGDLGEKLACEYLVKNGYKILGRNYRITFGEIDIIAKKKFKLLATLYPLYAIRIPHNLFHSRAIEERQNSLP